MSSGSIDTRIVPNEESSCVVRHDNATFEQLVLNPPVPMTAWCVTETNTFQLLKTDTDHNHLARHLDKVAFLTHKHVSPEYIWSHVWIVSTYRRPSMDLLLGSCVQQVFNLLCMSYRNIQFSGTVSKQERSILINAVSSLYSSLDSVSRVQLEQQRASGPEREHKKELWVISNCIVFPGGEGFQLLETPRRALSLAYHVFFNGIEEVPTYEDVCRTLEQQVFAPGSVSICEYGYWKKIPTTLLPLKSRHIRMLDPRTCHGSLDAEDAIRTLDVAHGPQSEFSIYRTVVMNCLISTMRFTRNLPMLIEYLRSWYRSMSLQFTPKSRDWFERYVRLSDEAYQCMLQSYPSRHVLGQYKHVYDMFYYIFWIMCMRDKLQHTRRKCLDTIVPILYNDILSQDFEIIFDHGFWEHTRCYIMECIQRRAHVSGIVVRMFGNTGDWERDNEENIAKQRGRIPDDVVQYILKHCRVAPNQRVTTAASGSAGDTSQEGPDSYCPLCTEENVEDVYKMPCCNATVCKDCFLNYAPTCSWCFMCRVSLEKIPGTA